MHVRVRTLVSDHLSLALLPTSGSTRHSPPAINIYSQCTDGPSTIGTSILSVAHYHVSFLHASSEQDILRGQGGSLCKCTLSIRRRLSCKVQHWKRYRLDYHRQKNGFTGDLSQPSPSVLSHWRDPRSSVSSSYYPSSLLPCVGGPGRRPSSPS